jgi:hypothetical protein
MTEEQTTISALIWEGDRAPLAKAFVAAQKATESVKKAATNPAFKSKYADLAHVVEGVIPALNAAGVGVLQFPGFDGQMVSVTTTLLHESGSSVTSTLAMRPTKSDPQGVGSAITYARRYSLLAMTGAAPEDDDGNAASRPAKDYGPAPLADDFQGSDGQRGQSSYAAKKNGADKRFNELRSEIADLESPAACGAWAAARAEEIKAFPEAWRRELRGELETQRALVAQPEEMEPAE